MIRRTLLLGLLVGLAAAAPAQAWTSGRVLMLHCARGLTASERAVTFEARIGAIPGARRMQMRFTLQARTPDPGAWSAIPADGFGTWITAPPGLDRYAYDKT